MADCDKTCDDDSSSTCPTDPKYLLTKVNEVKADTDPNVETTEKDCAIKEPQYDVIEQDYILPAVGATGPLYLCNPSIYAVGQWIRFEDGTKVQVIGIENTHLITRNSCPDAVTAIETNSDPGTAFRSNEKVWLGEPPACGSSGFCEEATDCLDDAESVCLSSVADAPTDAQVFLWGRVANCFRKLLNIFAFNNTFCYPSVPETDGDKVGSNSKRFAVYVPDGGSGNDQCQNALEIGTDGLYRVCQGNIKFIDNARVPVITSRATLLDESVLHSQLGTFQRTLALPDFPEACGASGVCAMIEAQAFAHTGTSNNVFKLQFLVNSQEIMLVSGNEQVSASAPFPGTSNGTTVVCNLTNPSISFDVINELPMASGQVDLKVWLTLYYV